MTSPSLRKAFVLGAGLGKRLQPLTAKRPKPLIPIFQKPLITFAFDHLLSCGISDIIVNTHHCSEMYGKMFPHTEAGFEYRNARVTLRHEPTLLETGGGIKNIEDLIGSEPFLVYNGDVLADIPLSSFIEHHFSSGNIATLLLRSSGGPLQVQWDRASGSILDLGGKIGAFPASPGFLFTGIYILDPRIFSWLEAGHITSITPVFVEMIRRKEKVGGFLCDEGMWRDLGTRDAYLEVHRELERRNFQLSYPVSSPWPVHVAESAHIEEGASLSGMVVAGENSHIGAGACLHDTILWEDIEIASGSSLDRCIITSGQSVQGCFSEKDFG
ncbi:MAG: sugar phosphate nucleotidyltransferase [Chthoniobacterales bacterium]